jgi:hypothetical protein
MSALQKIALPTIAITRTLAETIIAQLLLLILRRSCGSLDEAATSDSAIGIISGCHDPLADAVA